MSQELERYQRLKARRTALKGSATRKLKRLTELSQCEVLNKAAYDQSYTSLQETLNSLRENLNLIINLSLDLNKELYEEIVKDIEINEETIEGFEARAIELKCDFDLNYEKSIHLKAEPLSKESVTKPKFKPRDLIAPKWDGDIVTLNAWKYQINEYFDLTDLTTDSEQLTILLYQPVLPASLQTSFRDCTTVNGQNGVWQRLNNKFPINSIPRAILQKLKETKPMNSNSAREMRRILEQIKDFSRHSRLADRAEELSSLSTLDLIEQKLTSNLVRSFRRWLNKENRDKPVTIDLLITFLQQETEIEERLSVTINASYHKSSSSVNQLRSNSNDLCALCNKSSHRFVDCTVFRGYTPQQRTDAMRKLGRCFTCLAVMHRTATDCRYRRRCTNCGKSHHTTLACVKPNPRLDRGVANARSPTPLNVNAAEFQPSNANVRTTNQLKSSPAYSPSTIVELLDANGTWHKAVALLDSGSDVTLIKRDTAQMLNLNRKPYTFKFGTAGGGYRSENSATVSLWIRRHDHPSSRFNITAIELEKPAHDISKLGEQIFKDQSYLRPIESCVPIEKTSIDILIGYDCAYLMKPTGYLQHPIQPDNNPTGVETPLGWYIYGPKEQSNVISNELRTVHRLYVEQNVEQFISMYESDICGVKPTKICACTDKEVKESQFLKHVRNTIRQNEDGRIEVSLPWKEGFPNCLEFNRDLAYAKLKSLESRLFKSNLMENYKKEMNIILGEYAEPVQKSDIIEKKGWYINHFPVVRPEKSTSCRIVWNSAATYKGISLNEGLYKGPDLLNNLFCVLLAWRQDTVAITGDIQKMFNQIQISAKDRIYHRFLWRDGNVSKPPKDFQWKRLPFGDKPAPDLSISALRFLADQHLKILPVASRIISDHCYMDDLATSFPSTMEAFAIKKNINTILESGKLALKGWHSNSPEVDEFSEVAETKILGHCWNKIVDNFGPSFEANIEIPTTKRSVLSAAAKLWDPIGIFSPLTLKLRLILQSLWQLSISWDDELPCSVKIVLTQVFNEILNFRNYRIPRKLKPSSITGPVELHGFCDGGELAYGAVIWLRWPLRETFKLTFLASKAYVAPLKKRSVPRLELMAAVILARLVTIVRTTINVIKLVLWTDSATVLHWLQMPVSNFKPFVSTRIQEIRETIPEAPDCFQYIKSSLNPADALTKPIKNFRLSLWHEGPEFLTKPDEGWPVIDLPPKDSSISSKEEKRNLINVFHVDLSEKTFTETLLEKVSNWTKLVRIIAWLRRPLIPCSERRAYLQATELKNAQLTLFWLAQEKLRLPEQRLLRQQLNIVSAENEPGGVLRVYGRLSNFSWNEYASNPIILPAENKVVRLFASDVHQNLGHQGYRVVIANLHQHGIYILRGKKLLKSIASKCMKCRLFRRRLLEQQMGQLPKFRLKPHHPPFTSIALDYFGPVKLKKTRNVIIDASIILITCTTTRVVHLEITETQSTNDFLLAWRRFTSKRCIHPTHVFSDAGKSFVGAQKPIRDWISNWDKIRIKENLAGKGTKFEFVWEFNTPQASHMNGVVESLVRSCRKSLENVCNYQKYSYSRSEWETIISELNYLVNSRPMFPKSVEDLDEEPFSGNTLLHPYGQQPVPQTDVSEYIDPRVSFNRAQHFIKLFWETWMRNMPPHLLFRNKWFRSRDNLKKGDYVIILKPGLKGHPAPRGLWEHAIVEDTFPGSDGLVRKVELRLSGQRKLVRPIHKLCLLATAEELRIDNN